MSRSCPGSPDLVASQHKSKPSIVASVGLYISMFCGRGSWNLRCTGDHQNMGVAHQNWAWSKFFMHVILYMSSLKEFILQQNPLSIVALPFQ